jgi:hypothetical protein
MQKQTIRYTIDRESRFVHFNKNWLTFALENCGEHLLPELLLHRNLWTYIAGLENRYMFKLLLNHVREKHQAVEFPFRCDAPDRRRFLTMQISPGDNDTCHFTTRLLKEEKRSFLLLIDTNQPRSRLRLPICSWCKKLKISALKWAEVEDAPEINMAQYKKLPELLHTICPGCQELMMQLIKNNMGHQG